MTTLHDRLADLADSAPPGGPVPDLWNAGVRRSRRRRAAAVLVAAALVALVGALGSAVEPGHGRHVATPSVDPRSALHLPLAVYPPSPWAQGTDETGAPGPLAVVSMAERNAAHGLRGTRQSFEPFGVSAVDGSAVFLDLPGTDPDRLGSYALALSPDGTKVGYVRYRAVGRPVGFAVYDAVTGRTMMLGDRRLRGGASTEGTDLQFSGDSRFLVTTVEDRDSTAKWRHALVAWDVVSGEPAVAERAGHYWLPNLGSGPQGVVWSRVAEIFTFEPAVGSAAQVRVPFDVVQASFGPDGVALAVVVGGAKSGTPWRLYAGSSARHLRLVPLGIDADQLIGWRDPRHVLVRQLPTGEVAEVDITTGSSVVLPVDVAGRQMLLPAYAADLWANPLVAGRRPPHLRDPRLPWWIGGGIGGVLGLVALGWWWRRARS